jgi:ABC-type Mn2+/Zn2+ transport system ATPase subunit
VIGYVPQRIEAELDFPLTVRQVVALPATLGLRAWERVPPETEGHIDESLRVVGMLERARSPIGRLSGGQLQRVMIARALACSPRVLVLDEPMVGIDVAGQQQFASLLERLHGEMGLTIVVVSHDIRTVAAGCDRVACLSRTLHSHTAPAGLTPEVLAEVFRHDVAAIFGGDLHVHAHAAGACPIESAEKSHGQAHGPGCAHDHGPGGTPA